MDTNKDLDIPTQKEMISTFRCNAISAELLEDEPQVACNKWQESIENKEFIKDLGAEMNQVVTSVLGMKNYQ